MPTPKTKELVAIFGYLNNHATAALEELAHSNPAYSVKFYYLLDFPAFRAENNWKIPAGAQKLCLKHPAKLLRGIRHAISAPNIYFHGFTTPRFYMALLLWIVIHLGKCQRILVASEGLKKNPGKSMRLFLRYLLNHKKIVHLGIGAGASNDFYNIGFKKWTFLKYAFCEKYDSEQQRLVDSKTADGSGPFKILSVGQLIERKNHSRLIRAISLLSDPTKVIVDIAGSGPLEEDLTAEVNLLSIKDQIKFRGFCDHATLNQLFSEADLFVLQSHYDGWGVVVGHAAHFGLPIIVSPRVRSGEGFLVEPSVNGFITPSDRELADRIEELLIDIPLRTSMRQRSLELAKLWGVKSVAKRLGQLLENPSVVFETGPFSSGSLHERLRSHD